MSEDINLEQLVTQPKYMEWLTNDDRAKVLSYVIGAILTSGLSRHSDLLSYSNHYKTTPILGFDFVLEFVCGVKFMCFIQYKSDGSLDIARIRICIFTDPTREDTSRVFIVMDCTTETPDFADLQTAVQARFDGAQLRETKLNTFDKIRLRRHLLTFESIKYGGSPEDMSLDQILFRKYTKEHQQFITVRQNLKWDNSADKPTADTEVPLDRLYEAKQSEGLHQISGFGSSNEALSSDSIKLVTEICAALDSCLVKWKELQAKDVPEKERAMRFFEDTYTTYFTLANLVRELAANINDEIPEFVGEYQRQYDNVLANAELHSRLLKGYRTVGDDFSERTEAADDFTEGSDDAVKDRREKFHTSFEHALMSWHSMLQDTSEETQLVVQDFARVYPELFKLLDSWDYDKWCLKSEPERPVAANNDTTGFSEDF